MTDTTPDGAGSATASEKPVQSATNEHVSADVASELFL